MSRVIIDRNGMGQLRVAAVQGSFKVAQAIAADATRYVPVDSGELRASIRVERGAVVHRIWFGDVAAGVDYHLYQEFGTSVMQAQPYIRPATYQYRSGL
jgi:HK97 gp10 family phage protein